MKLIDRLRKCISETTVFRWDQIKTGYGYKTKFTVVAQWTIIHPNIVMLRQDDAIFVPKYPANDTTFHVKH